MTDSPPTPRERARARELTVLACIVATVLWTVALIEVTGANGRGRLSNLPIGTDFVAFYTYAYIGHTGRFELLRSERAFYDTQVSLVPASATTVHPPLYPVQVALALAPLNRLGYQQALLAWTLVTFAGYFWTVRGFMLASSSLRSWPKQVVAVAAASPALWLLTLHGQLSIVGLVGLYLAWRFLASGRTAIAGLALGLLAYKPSLFVPALAVCALAGEWRLAAAAVMAGAAQYLAAVPWAGPEAVNGYLELLANLAARPDRVAGNPALMHSLRTFWAGWLPAFPALLAYAVSSLAVLTVAARAWRDAGSALDRVAVLGLTIVLVSPHLYVYDLILLTPLLVAAADHLVTNPTPLLKRLTLAVYFAPLWGIPIATLGIQASTIAFVAILPIFHRSRHAAPCVPGPAT